MLRYLIIAVLIVSFSACQADVDERQPEDTGALPEPPAEEVPSPIDEEDTIEVPLHVPPVDPDLDDEEENNGNNY